jgi:hypothetical protein
MIYNTEGRADYHGPFKSVSSFHAAVEGNALNRRTRQTDVGSLFPQHGNVLGREVALETQGPELQTVRHDPDQCPLWHQCLSEPGEDRINVASALSRVRHKRHWYGSTHSPVMRSHR